MDNILTITTTIIITVLVTAVIAAVYIEFVIRQRYETELKKYKNQNNQNNQNKQNKQQSTDESKKHLYDQIEEKMTFWRIAFSNLLNSMPVAASVFSYDGKRYCVNNHFITLFGVKDDIKTELWETPVISEKLKDRIRKEDDFDTKIEIDFSDPKVREWFGTTNTESKFLNLCMHKFYVPDYQQPFIIFITNDVTEIEKTRQREKGIIKLAKKIYALNTLKVWRYLIDSGETEFFNEGGVITKCDASEYFSQFEPKDTVMLMTAFQKIIEGKLPEKRIVMRIADDSVQGGYSYWNTLTEPIYENGKVTKIEGMCHRVTYQTLLKQLKIKDFRNSGASLVTKFVYEVKTDNLIISGKKSGISFASYLKNVHPEDLEKNQKVISEVKSGKQVYATISYRYKTDNIWQNVQLFITPTEVDNDGKVLTFSGVVMTNQKLENLVPSLKDGDSFLKALINAIPCMLAIKSPDEDFHFLMVNKQCCEGFALEPEMILNRNEFEVFGHSPVTEEGRAADEKAVREGYAELESEFTYNGMQYSVHYYKTLYVNSNKQRYIICCGVNTSKYKSIIKRLEAAKTLAEKSENLRTTFLKNVSHEIRTPMNYINGFSELLVKNAGKTTFNSEEAFQQIFIGCNELTRQVENLVDSSKMISGFVEFLYSKFNLSQLFNEIFLKFQPEVENKNFKLIIENPYPYCIINSDKKYVRRIMEIYVSNSLKYTVRGYVKMGYKYQNNGIYLYVEDTGCGIPDEDKEKVFLPFEKLHQEKRGIGLGLPICKTIVDNANGKIGFSSQEKKGSLFWAWLPTDVNIFTMPPVNYESVSKQYALDPRKKYKILIAVSDINCYSLLDNALEGYNTQNAFDGDTLINKALSETYDLIIAGVELQYFSGLEAAEKIRQAGNSTPIVAIMETGYQSDYETALNSGCNDTLSKPISIEKLKSIMSKYGIE
ncbi:MAG: response regulator [Bacteroidales bacterium]|nr:response regulator [Bacteroidales bacterium]